MATIQNFLLSYPKTGFFMMVLLVLVLTTIIKLPIKHFTNKIKNDKLKSFLSSLFVIITLVVGIGAGWFYTYLTGGEFRYGVSIALSIMGASVYDLIQVPKKLGLYIIDCIKNKRALKLEDMTDIVKDTLDKDSKSKEKKHTDDVKDAIKEFDDICKR